MNEPPELRILLAKLSAEFCKEGVVSDNEMKDSFLRYNPSEIAEILLNDGLLGFLWKPLSSLYEFPASQRTIIKNYLFDTCRRELLVHRQLPMLWSLFKDEGLDPILLRGPSWQRYYPSEVIRDLSDIDLLIHPDQKTKIDIFFEAMGYKRSFHCPDVWLKDGVTLDIHTDVMGITWLPASVYAGNIPLQELFDRKKTIQFEFMTRCQGRRLDINAFNLGGLTAESSIFQGDEKELLKISVLEEADDLICASIHWVKHSFNRLSWSVDLLMLCDQVNKLDLWEEVTERIERYKVDGLVGFGLLPVRRIFNADIPDSVISGNMRSNSSVVSRWIIETISKGRRFEPAGYLLFASSIGNIFRKFQFYFEIVFPRRKVRRRMFRRYPDAPRWLFPYFHISRGLSGTMRLIKGLL